MTTAQQVATDEPTEIPDIPRDSTEIPETMTTTAENDEEPQPPVNQDDHHEDEALLDEEQEEESRTNMNNQPHDTETELPPGGWGTRLDDRSKVDEPYEPPHHHHQHYSEQMLDQQQQQQEPEQAEPIHDESATNMHSSEHDRDSNIYEARERWGKIRNPPPSSRQTIHDSFADQQDDEYQSDQYYHYPPASEPQQEPVYLQGLQQLLAQPNEEEYDDRTLLDIFGEVAKEYLTQKVVRSACVVNCLGLDITNE